MNKLCISVLRLDLEESLFVGTTSSMAELIQGFNRFFKCPSNDGACEGTILLLFVLYTCVFVCKHKHNSFLVMEMRDWVFYTLAFCFSWNTLADLSFVASQASFLISFCKFWTYLQTSHYVLKL